MAAAAPAKRLNPLEPTKGIRAFCAYLGQFQGGEHIRIPHMLEGSHGRVAWVFADAILAVGEAIGSAKVVRQIARILEERMGFRPSFEEQRNPTVTGQDAATAGLISLVFALQEAWGRIPLDQPAIRRALLAILIDATGSESKSPGTKQGLALIEKALAWLPVTTHPNDLYNLIDANGLALTSESDGGLRFRPYTKTLSASPQRWRMVKRGTGGVEILSSVDGHSLVNGGDEPIMQVRSGTTSAAWIPLYIEEPRIAVIDPQCGHALAVDGGELVLRGISAITRESGLRLVSTRNQLERWINTDVIFNVGVNRTPEEPEPGSTQSRKVNK